MEMQEKIETVCDNCKAILIVPTVTDFGMTFQIAPAKCSCGWEQPGKWLRNGFIVDDPIGYFNLRKTEGKRYENDK